MAWTPPAFAPGVIWQDRPSSATPLDAQNLNLEENSEAAYAAMVGTSLASYFEGGSSPFVPTEIVLSPGNLGAAYTIDFASKPNVYVTLVATLNANATITFANRASGCRAVLLLVQDTTGGWTLNVSDGSASTVISVQPTVATLTSLQVDCPNGTDIYVSPLGSGGLPNTVAVSSVVPASAGLLPVSTGSTSSVIDWVDSPYVICNGSTDAAITAAIAALPTVVHPTLGSVQWGTVILPPRTYTFSSSVQIPSHCHVDGLHRAICVRANSFTGLLFTAAGAVTDIALNGIIWDNNATANLMWQIPNGSSQIDHIWARYQNTSGNVCQVAGGASLNYDVTVKDIRIYAVGSPSNQNGLEFYDCTNLSVKGVKSLIQSGSNALSALNCQALGSAPACRNWNIEDVEIDTPNATALFVRNNFGGVIEDVSVKGIRGQGIGSLSIPKGLVDMGEQAVGTPGQSTTCGITVEDVEGRDWWGVLVTIGTADSGGGNVFDFNVSDVRGDGATVAGSVDTSRGNSVLNVTGARYGNIDGIVARNTGRGGIRFITTTFQAPAYIRCSNLDVEACVQNPSLVAPSTWEECGIFIDSGCHDLTFDNVRSANNYSASNPGGSQVGAGIGMKNGTQSNITIINPVCTDTRGTQFQDIGIRLGESGADNTQPSNVTIIGGDLGGNLTAGIYGVPGSTWPYASTDHGHRLIGTRNTGVGDFISLSQRPQAALTARNVLAETVPIAALQGVSTIPTQELTLGLVGLVAGDSVKGLAFNLTTTAGGLSLFKVGLFDSSGNILASSADQSGTINSSGMKSVAWSASPFVVTASSAYYVGVLAVYTSGVIQIDRSGTGSRIAVQIDGGKFPYVKVITQTDISGNVSVASGGNNAQAAYHFMAYS